MGKLYDICQGFAFSGIASYGEYLQCVARVDPKQYTWLTGHLSDIAAIGASVSFTNVIIHMPKEWKDLKRENKLLDMLLVSTPAAMIQSIYELVDGSQTYDPQDIACYWSGAALAYGLSTLVGSKKSEQHLEDKVK